MSDDSKRRIRFGPFEADLIAGELRKNGHLLRLQDQPFRILETLLKRPGEIVTRDELRHEIWGEEVYVDFDRSLNTSVARLREALGDSPTRPAFVETVPRKGYRFIGPLGAESGGESQRSSPAPPETNGRWRISHLLLAAVVAGMAGFYLSRSNAPRGASSPPPMPERLTSYDGAEDEATFSPDGSQFAFTWNGENQDNYDIYVRSVSGGAPHRLTTHPNRDSSPIWSPDGQWIVFGRRMDDGSVGVFRVPPSGGREIRVLSLPRQGDDGMEPRAMTWAPDSKRLAIVQRLRDENDSLIFLADLETGSRNTLLRLRGVFQPSFSPDGRWLAYSDDTRGCFVLLLSATGQPAGDPVRVDIGQSCFSPVWTPDGSRLVMEAAFESSLPTLWFAKPDGSEAVSLSVQAMGMGFANTLAPAVGPKGVVAFRQDLTRRSIWRLDLQSGEAIPLISSSGRNDDAAYSPDGKRILFTSTRGPIGVWIANADGSEPSPLVEGGADARWSIDGKKVVFRALRPGGPIVPGPQDLWVMDAQGGAPVNLTNDPSSRAAAPLWSRDGKWIYFASDMRPSKMPSNGGEPTILLEGRAAPVDQSHDGRWLFLGAGSSRGTTISRLSPEGDYEVLLKDVIGWCGVSVTDDGLYYQAGDPDSGYEIRFYRFDDRSSSVVYRMEGKAGTTIDLSTDGRYLLFAQDEMPQSDLMILRGNDW